MIQIRVRNKSAQRRELSVWQICGKIKRAPNCKADEQVLNNIFLGIHSDAPYDGHVDEKWLTNELTRDMASLRMLIGLSVEEAADVLGVSEVTCRELENGSREPSWDQYMTLLFLYHYNMRTTDIVKNLGLYPDSLREKIRIGEG